jgi:hypothetical protein
MKLDFHACGMALFIIFRKTERLSAIGCHAFCDHQSESELESEELESEP